MSHYKPINNDKQRASRCCRPGFLVGSYSNRQSAAQSVAWLNVHTGRDAAHSQCRCAPAQFSGLNKQTARCWPGRRSAWGRKQRRFKTDGQTNKKSCFVFIFFYSPHPPNGPKAAPILKVDAGQEGGSRTQRDRTENWCKDTMRFQNLNQTNKMGTKEVNTRGRCWDGCGNPLGRWQASQEERAWEAADRQTAGRWSMKDKGGKGSS